MAAELQRGSSLQTDNFEGMRDDSALYISETNVLNLGDDQKNSEGEESDISDGMQEGNMEEEQDYDSQVDKRF